MEKNGRNNMQVDVVREIVDRLDLHFPTKASQGLMIQRYLEKIKAVKSIREDELGNRWMNFEGKFYNLSEEEQTQIVSMLETKVLDILRSMERDVIRQGVKFAEIVKQVGIPYFPDPLVAGFVDETLNVRGLTNGAIQNSFSDE